MVVERMSIVAWSTAATGDATVIPWTTVGTVASLLLATASMIVAIWQTRIARRAAHTAQEAATAASIQARATVEQANLLRRQLEAETLDRVHRAAPKFSLRATGDEEWGTLREGSDALFAAISLENPPPIREWVKRQTLELQMVEGPGELTVEVRTVRAPSARIRPLSGPVVARLGFLRFEMLTPYEISGKQVTLEIRSADATSPDNGGFWLTNLSITA